MEEIKDAEFEELVSETDSPTEIGESSSVNTEDSKELGITQEEFMEMWAKMHSPIVCEKRMPKRNEICPFCNSGKKFKNCECFSKYENVYKYDLTKTKILG